MKAFPSGHQVASVKTWKELFDLLEVNQRNTRSIASIKEFVRINFPESVVVSSRRSGKLTDEEFADMVSNSQSIREIILKGGWKMAGGTYNMIKTRIKRQGLSDSHMTGHNSKAANIARTRPIEDYLVKDCYSINSHRLKIRLIKEGIKQHKCETCGVETWLGKEAPICLDHINGDHHDNRLENIRILCHNCHAQTDTFSGKRHRKQRNKCSQCDNEVKHNSSLTCGSRLCVSLQHSASKSKIDRKKIKITSNATTFCPQCGNGKQTSNKYCSYTCAQASQQRINWNAVNLTEELKTKNFSQLGRELGVSDNAIRKQLKKLM